MCPSSVDISSAAEFFLHCLGRPELSRRFLSYLNYARGQEHLEKGVLARAGPGPRSRTVLPQSSFPTDSGSRELKFSSVKSSRTSRSSPLGALRPPDLATNRRTGAHSTSVPLTPSLITESPLITPSLCLAHVVCRRRTTVCKLYPGHHSRRRRRQQKFKGEREAPALSLSIHCMTSVEGAARTRFPSRMVASVGRTDRTRVWKAFHRPGTSESILFLLFYFSTYHGHGKF